MLQECNLLHLLHYIQRGVILSVFIFNLQNSQWSRCWQSETWLRWESLRRTGACDHWAHGWTVVDHVCQPVQWENWGECREWCHLSDHWKVGYCALQSQLHICQLTNTHLSASNKSILLCKSIREVFWLTSRLYTASQSHILILLLLSALSSSKYPCQSCLALITSLWQQAQVYAYGLELTLGALLLKRGVAEGARSMKVNVEAVERLPVRDNGV